MISGLDELRDAKEILKDVKADLTREGIPFASDIPLGIMIEVPSAVLLGHELAAECDFFSIGTNDLIQYTLAVDRGNERVAHLYEPAHPAVLRMIQSAVTSAKEASIPCGMCGAMAGDPMFTKLLIGLGVTSLSMPALLRRDVYNRASAIRISEAREFATRATQCEESQQVWKLLRDAAVDWERATA